jgi:catechol 2,3-dioxygenase-like lactoylglutathione lyase family enzyme
VTSRLAVVVIDASHPRRIADFWCAVLGWRIVAEEDDGVITIGPAGRSWPTIDVAPVPESKTIKNRLHLDLRADGISTAAELDRLFSLGARPADVGQPADTSWVVLADPEGNEFCLLSRTVQEAGGPRS